MASQTKMTQQSNKVVKVSVVLIVCSVFWLVLNSWITPSHPLDNICSSRVYQSPQSQSNDLIPTSINYNNEFPPGDDTRLIDLTTFQFTKLSLVCNDIHDNPTLLLLVHSAPKRYARRASIRSTWGTLSNSLRVAFLLGAVDAQTQKDLDAENHRHGDLVQGNFIDAYRNMTYKHVMALKYAVYHCPKARFVLKVDDDILVNMPTLLAYLQVEYTNEVARNLLMCDVIYNSPAFRTHTKWNVSFSEYQQSEYPPYCPGWIILYSMDLVFALYREAQQTTYFWIDDVLITGILPQKLRIMHTPIKEYIASHNDLNTMIKTNSIDKLFICGRSEVSMETNKLVWDVIIENLRRLRKTIVAKAISP